jgi:hypothetical protein
LRCGNEKRYLPLFGKCVVQLVQKLAQAGGVGLHHAHLHFDGHLEVQVIFAFTQSGDVAGGL